MESDVELVNENRNSQIDKQEKANQARVMLMNRMRNIRVQKDLEKPKHKNIDKKQVSNGNGTRRTHESHVDMCT
eukprot:4608251-Heterocapsa_arctica.AAC.1